MATTNESYIQAAIAGALSDFHGAAGPGNINDPLFALACRLLELSHAAPDVLSEADAEQHAADAAATYGHDKASVKATLRSAAKTTAGQSASIPAPTCTNGHAPQGYADLAAYAAAHGVPCAVFVAAGWSDSVIYAYTYQDKGGDEATGYSDTGERLTSVPRRALRFETDAGPRWRLIDIDKPKPKYWQRPGTHQGASRVWYRLGNALALASQVGYLALCNGEASTVAAQHYGVPALCEAGGGEKAIPDHLLVLLRAVWPGRILIALDCDGAGRKAALTKAAQLRGAGWGDVRALDLSLGTGGDLADFCRLHTTQSAAQLPLCADIPAPVPPGAMPIAPQRTQSQAIIDQLMQLGYTFRLNRCTQLIECNGEPLNDMKSAEIRTRLRDAGWSKLPAVEDAYMTEATAQAYHPIRDYFDNLTWDGKNHIGALAMCLRHDDPPVTYQDGGSVSLASVYLHRWLIGAVAKALAHEQNAMLVLMGPQNLGKSHFSRWLCPPCLAKNHYIESPIDLTDKDSRIRLMTKLIWEVSELDATTRKSDVAALKHFVTQQEVTVRRAYGRYDTVGPALASMIGTVNSDGFLADETGNRRFFVISLTGIDWAYQSLDIDQVWAEAIARYRRGEPWQLTTEERLHQAKRNRQYYQETPIHDYVRRHIVVTNDPAHKMSGADVIDVLRRNNVTLSPSDHSMYIQISRAMASLGVERKREPGTGARFYSGIMERL